MVGEGSGAQRALESPSNEESPMEPAPFSSPSADPVEWTCVLPFYNEAPMLTRTLTSLASQKVPFKLVLVDNGSTDGSGEVAQSVAEDLGIDYRVLAS